MSRFDTVTRAQRLAHDHEERTHGREHDLSLAEQLEVADAEFRHFDSFIFAPGSHAWPRANGGESCLPASTSGSSPPSFARGAAAPGSHARERAAVSSSGSSDGGPALTQPAWRPVVGFEDCYEVSADGRVRRTKGGPGARAGRFLKPRPQKSGHLRVVLCRDGTTTDKFVHQLVCRAFHGPSPTAGHEVAHNNGQPADNHYENLRWATRRENEADKDRHGTRPAGENFAGSKYRDAEIQRVLDLSAAGASQKEIVAATGMSQSNVSGVLDGTRRRTHPNVPSHVPPSPKHNGQAGSDAGAVTAPSERPGVANSSWETWVWAA